jgi:hypothetical protein
MGPAAQTLALALASLTIGWTACLCFFVSPLAFKTLKGRAENFVRRLIRQGHGFLAMFALLSAGCAVIGGSIAGAAVMASCGMCFFLAQWTLHPDNQSEAVPGVRNTSRKRLRVTASLMTAMVMPIVLIGMLLIGLKI